MSSSSFRLGFVPEQVNLPLLLCLEKGIFARHGLDVSFQLVPEGTGKMLELLENEEIDIAFPVTDAFIVAKAKGRPITLLGTYVASPLVWSAVAGKSAPFRNFQELRDLDRPVTVAISRFGSGSHTMGQYTGSLHGLQNLQFHVSNTFAGLRDDVNSGAADFFLWERFTTKPWVDKGELILIGEAPTPWTAFSIASKLMPITGTVCIPFTVLIFFLINCKMSESKTYTSCLTQYWRG